MGTRGGSNGPRRAAALGEFSLLVGLECLPLSTVQPPAVNTEAAELRIEDIGSSQTDGGSMCAIAACAPITASSALLPSPLPVVRPCTMASNPLLTPLLTPQIHTRHTETRQERWDRGATHRHPHGNVWRAQGLHRHLLQAMLMLPQQSPSHQCITAIPCTDLN